MELFAGSAGLSSEVRKAGFRVIAIDHEFNRHSPKVSLIVLDLTKPHAQDMFIKMLHHLKPMSLHFGLPCGTCSRAREKQLPAHLRDRYNAPRPLRDSENLLGFPWLRGSDWDKTQSANALYRFAVQLLLICWKLSISPSIENPTRSWLWGVLALLVAELKIDSFTQWFSRLRKTSFHACEHGSQRNKQTSILAPPGFLMTWKHLVMGNTPICHGRSNPLDADWHLLQQTKQLILPFFAPAWPGCYRDMQSR